LRRYPASCHPLLCLPLVFTGLSWLMNWLGTFRFKAGEWSVVVAVMLTVRFLQPRFMLFIGIKASCMQILAIRLLAALTAGFPDGVMEIVSLLLSALVAGGLSLGARSPAARVGQTWVPWLFAAFGALKLMLERWELLLFSFGEMVAGLAFLVSFVWLVQVTRPANADPVSRTPPGWGLVLMAFLAWYMAVGLLFGVQE
jgi:hypothetical protein